MPDIPIEQIRIAIRPMKNRKCSGDDRITSEMLKLGVDTIHLTELLFGIYHWLNADVALIVKKENTTNIENYRPMSLLSNFYKLLTRLMANRFSIKLDFS